MTGIYKIVDAANNLLWGKNILVFMLIGAILMSLSGILKI